MQFRLEYTNMTLSGARTALCSIPRDWIHCVLTISLYEIWLILLHTSPVRISPRRFSAAYWLGSSVRLSLNPMRIRESKNEAYLGRSNRVEPIRVTLISTRCSRKVQPVFNRPEDTNLCNFSISRELGRVFPRFPPFPKSPNYPRGNNTIEPQSPECPSLPSTPKTHPLGFVYAKSADPTGKYSPDGRGTVKTLAGRWSCQTRSRREEGKELPHYALSNGQLYTKHRSDPFTEESKEWRIPRVDPSE